MRTTQFITSIKKQGQEKISFIILGAACEYKQKHLGPKSLLKFNNQLLIHYQVETIKKQYNDVEIIFVSGFEHNKILKHKTNFRIVENTTYFDSGEFEQVRLALQNIESDNVFIVTDTTTNLNFNIEKRSKIYISNNAKENPGCTSQKYVEHIAYGIQNNITKGFFFCKTELEMLKKYVIENKEKKYKLFLFEIINDLISKGAKFKAEEVEYENFIIS